MTLREVYHDFQKLRHPLFSTLLHLKKTKPTKRPYKPFFNNEHLDKIDI